MRTRRSCGLLVLVLSKSGRENLGLLGGDVHTKTPQEQQKCAVKIAVEFYSKIGYTMGKKGDEWAMPNIKPISDLRNYSEVLHEVAVGTPVFLTKNGRGKYAILDIQDYEKTQATLQLISELNKGRKSGEKEGWVSSGELRGHFQRKADEK